MTGGVNGAAGAGASAWTTPAIAEKIAELDLPEEAKSALTLAVGAAIGAAAGGGAGGVTAINEVAFNYLDHRWKGFRSPSEKALFDTAVADCNKGDAGACTVRDKLNTISQARDNAITAACTQGSEKDCGDLVRLAQAAGNKVVFGAGRRAYVYPIDV